MGTEAACMSCDRASERADEIGELRGVQWRPQARDVHLGELKAGHVTYLGIGSVTALA